METPAEERNNTLTTLSRVASVVLHPFLVPVILLAGVFMSGLVPLYMVPSFRHYIFDLVLINSVAVPAIAIILMRLAGVIKDY